MPYPPTHLLFFGLSVFIAGVFAMSALSFEGKLRISDKRYLAVLLIAGGIGSLFPDVPAVWNLILHGCLRHSMVGPIPSHSLLFGLITMTLTTTLGYIAYRDRIRAASLGLLVGAAFLFHLVLDDLEGGVIPYLYPLYDGPLSLFDAGVFVHILRMMRSLLL